MKTTSILKEEWMYSDSEENWSYDEVFATKEEALEAAKIELNHLEEGANIYIGKKVEIDFCFQDYETYLDKFSETAYHDSHEDIETNVDVWIDDIYKSKKTTDFIQQKLDEIEAYILKNHKMNFYNVTDIEIC